MPRIPVINPNAPLGCTAETRNGIKHDGEQEADHG